MVRDGSLGRSPRLSHCGGDRTIAVAYHRQMPYHCTGCRKYFSVKSGTVMQWSKLSLRQWLIGIHLMSTSLAGSPAMNFHRVVGVSRKRGWALAQKIREGWIAGTVGSHDRGWCGDG